MFLFDFIAVIIVVVRKNTFFKGYFYPCRACGRYIIRNYSKCNILGKAQLIINKKYRNLKLSDQSRVNHFNLIAQYAAYCQYKTSKIYFLQELLIQKKPNPFRISVACVLSLIFHIKMQSNSKWYYKYLFYMHYNNCVVYVYKHIFRD